MTSHLHRFVELTGQGTIYTEGGFALPRYPATVRGPDVAFVAAERLTEAAPLRTFPELAPDLAVEVVSPSNTAAELQEKVSEYLAAGSGVVWVLYPKTRATVVFRPGGEAELLGQADTLDGGEVLPGFSVRLKDLFA